MRVPARDTSRISASKGIETSFIGLYRMISAKHFGEDRGPMPFSVVPRLHGRCAKAWRRPLYRASEDLSVGE
jgi:hypothetical protein